MITIVRVAVVVLAAVTSGWLILAYFAEGVMRAWSDTGASQKLSFLELLLSAVFFAAAVSYARLTRAAV